MPDLRQLLDAATPGPWRWTPGAHASDDEGYTATVVVDDDSAPDAETVFVAACWAGEDGRASDPDAALIVAAVNALPALLDVDAYLDSIPVMTAEELRRRWPASVERLLDGADATRQSAPEAGLRTWLAHKPDCRKVGGGITGPQPCSCGLDAALATPAPDTAAHLAWLRDGDRLARALSQMVWGDEDPTEDRSLWGIDSDLTDSGVDTPADLAAIIAALEAQP